VPARFSVHGTETRECPVSLITPESFELVQILSSAEDIYRSTGAVALGPDASQWDARLYDAARLVANEEARIKNAHSDFQNK